MLACYKTKIIRMTPVLVMRQMVNHGRVEKTNMPYSCWFFLHSAPSAPMYLPGKFGQSTKTQTRAIARDPL